MGREIWRSVYWQARDSESDNRKKGGDWASSVPAWCDVDCRIAILPGWSVADCQAEIRACVSAAARDHRFLSNNPPEVEWSGFLSVTS
jgi:acetylornithine deacetylase